MALAIVCAVPVLSAQNVKEKFTGFAINMNGAANTATVDFTIERWSTDAERTDVAGAHSRQSTRPAEAGERAAEDEERRQHSHAADAGVGPALCPRVQGWTRAGAASSSSPIVRSASAKPRNQNRSMDYPFTILEIRLNAKDEGEGKIFGGSKVYVEKDELVVENWGTQPTRFNNIKKQK